MKNLLDAHVDTEFVFAIGMPWRSSQAPAAAVDNSAPSSTHPKSAYKSWKAVQITGTTSKCDSIYRYGAGSMF